MTYGTAHFLGVHPDDHPGGRLGAGLWSPGNRGCRLVYSSR